MSTKKLMKMFNEEIKDKSSETSLLLEEMTLRNKLQQLQELIEFEQRRNRRLSTIIESQDEQTQGKSSLESFSFADFDDIDDMDFQGKGDSQLKLPLENSYKFLEKKLKK